jgi:FxsC-like protein
MYQFDLSNLKIKNKLPLDDEESNQLIKQLFETWAGSSRQEGRKLKATLCQRTEGRSSVQVFELAFNYADNFKRAATFILRLHQNENDANEERTHAQEIENTASQYFAKFVDKQFNNPDLVVYRHVSDQTGADVYDLKEYLCDFSSNGTEEEVNYFTKHLEEFTHQIVKVYEKLSKRYFCENCSSYYEEIAHQLPPDLIINGYVDSSRDKTLVIEYGSSSPSLRVLKDQQSISATQLINQLDNIKKPDEEWIKVKDICLTSKSCLVGRDNIVYFSAVGEDDLQIWLGTHKEQYKTLNFEKEKRYELVFHKNAVKLFTTQLESIGFNTESCILRTDFQALCKKQRVDLFNKMRHNDLHCGNVLVSGQNLKIIDVGDMKPDLLASDLARLEVSIWFDVAGRIKISETEAEAIIKSTPNNNLSFKAWVLKQVLQSLHKGFEKGIERNPSKAEKVLAYVTQILFYQRYCLLEYGVDKISPAFNVFAGYWISQFRSKSEPKKSIPQNSTHSVPKISSKGNELPLDTREVPENSASPCHAVFFYVVGHADEIKQVRRNVGAYSNKKDEWWRWKPFERAVTYIAQEITAKKDISYEILSVTKNNLIQRLEEAKKFNKIVIIIVDPWSLQLNKYLEIMEEYDKHDFFNCDVLFVCNSNDQELTKDKQSELRGELKNILFTKTRKIPEFFLKREVNSFDKFRRKLSFVLRKVKQDIIRYGEIKR